MVSFLWGNSTLELPSNSSRIKSEMLEFIQEENTEFISYFVLAKENLQQKGEDPKELIDEFEKILKEINDSELMPLIRGHDDGEVAIKNFTTRKLRNETITNEDNVKFLNELKVSGLSDSATLNRLRGFGALKFGQAFENLPEFDAEDYLGQFGLLRDYPIDVDLTFKEVLPDEMDDYNSEMSPIRFSYGKQNIIFNAPFTDEEIIDVKKNYLIDTTKQEPDFAPSKTKSYPPRITMTMKIDIPEKVVKELSASAKITVQPVKSITDKNDRATGRYKDSGSSYEMEHSEFIELGVAGLKNRTSSMVDNRIYDLGDKGLVKIVKGNYEGAGRQVSVPDSTENEIKKKFLPMLKMVEESVIQPILSNPLKVHTYKGEVNFKTFRDATNSLTRKIERLAEGQQWKAGKDEDGNPAFINSVQVMVDGQYKNLSEEKAMELEGEAWTNKETGEKISNADYVSMDKAQRMAYKPNYYIITVDGSQRTPTNEVSTTHRNIRKYRLKDAPEDAYAEKAKKIEGYVLKPQESKKASDFFARYPAGFKRFVNEEEANELRQKLEARQEEENKKEKPSQFNTFDDFYKKGTTSEFEGNFISREEYEKLSDDDKLDTRLVEISPKRLNLGSLEKGDYEPIYDERELDPEAVDEKGKLTPQALKDAKELKFRERLRQRASKRVSRKPPKIEDPSKFGRVTDKALAVVTGEGFQLNPLVYYANIKEAFERTILHIELVVTDLGEFTLSPMQRRRNDEMANAIEDIKENLSVLTEKLGE